MIIANFVTNRATQSDTRTYEDFYKFLGTRPAKLGVVSRLYPELTASYLTESLRNIFYQDVKSGNRYQSIDSMYFEWEVAQSAHYYGNIIIVLSKIGKILLIKCYNQG